MRAKSKLFRYLLFLLLAASYTLLSQTINAEENGTDVNDTITATASLLRDSYTLGQPVPIEIAVANHGQKPVYIDVDEFGYLGLWVTVEDINGNKVEHGPVPSPPPPPRHWWITIDSKKIFTVPVVEIEPGQTTKLAIQDAFELYQGYLQEGVYYVKPRELSVIHEVDSIIVREDQEHPLWIDPYTVISRERYEINKVEITLYQEKIIYVDDDAVGLNDGTSWQNAYAFLQDALANAKLAEKPVEIRVAHGIYTPNQRTLQTPNNGDNTFTLINEVTVKGGYTGIGEPDPNARDIESCETILSGDLNGDDIVVDDPCDMLLVQSNRADNSPVVVRANHTDATAVLDGFVITGGYFMELATGPSTGGAGMHIYQGSPTIRNCTFTGNVARQIGGGLLNRGGSNPTLINCVFSGNYAESGGGIYNTPNMPAPGMVSEGSHPTLVNCTFDNNCALKNGGGMYNFQSNPTLIDCTFRRNQVTGPYSGSTRGPHTGGGGGMYNSNSSPVLTNCLFSENSAGGGGGICNIADSALTLTNCTFTDNVTSNSSGGGLLLSNNSNSMLVNCKFMRNHAESGGGIFCSGSSPTLINCTFSDNVTTNSGGGMYNSNSNPKLTNCVFTENFTVESNIIIEPIPSAGGGIYNYRSNTLLTDCTFIGNSASHGGGIFNYKSNSIITNCTFTANRGDYGGGITNIDCSPTLINCIITGNGTYYSYGGGMYGGSPTLINCTIIGNRAQECGGICYNNTNMVNCIVWSNSSPQILSSASISYSNIQDGWLGKGNIDVDPLFADPGYWADADDPNIVAEPNDPNAVWIDGDYHLKSQAGRWDPASESWVVDDVTSPCIDAGDPNSPIGHEPFPNGWIINMGAYGGTSEASKSISDINSRF